SQDTSGLDLKQWPATPTRTGLQKKRVFTASAQACPFTIIKPSLQAMGEGSCVKAATDFHKHLELTPYNPKL
ncbi:hypothetical protein LEMLEM_LOCUS18966, partial [Lemmus lemmus]